jgi:hypothetical protein
MRKSMAHAHPQTASLLGLFGHASRLESRRGTGFLVILWETPWITRGRSMGKEITQLWESGELRVVHKTSELFTKLSTQFSTLLAESCSTIHRLYYYNYFI